MRVVAIACSLTHSLELQAQCGDGSVWVTSLLVVMVCKLSVSRVGQRWAEKHKGRQVVGGDVQPPRLHLVL